MTGFIESEFDKRDMEYIPDYDIDTEALPEYYDYGKYCDLIIRNQGNTNTCVPTSISTMFEAMDYEPININDVYNKRSNKPEEGMTIRNALKILQKESDSYFQYFRLRSWPQIKYSIVANGPCILALPVRSENSEFWKGSDNLGGHAIACIGFDDEGFILQNSWGSQWGNYGRTKLKYEDINYIIEAWGVI